MEPAVELERFAALSAEIEAGAARDEVCAREGISVEAWTGAQEMWLARMAEETAAKRFELTNRYNAAFVARRLALQDGKRKPANKPFRAQKKPAAPPQKTPERAAIPPAKGEGLPTFMEAAAAAAPPIVAPPPARVEGLPSFMDAAAAAPPPPLAVPPQVVAPPPPLAAPPLEDHANDDAGSLTVVAAISPFAQKSALPFQGSGAAPAPPVNRSSGAQRGGLPFHAAGPAAPAPPAPPAPPALPPPVEQEFGSGTVVGAISPFAQGEALPFRGGGGAPPAPSKAPAPSAGLAGLPFRAGSPAAASIPQRPPKKPAAEPSSGHDGGLTRDAELRTASRSAPHTPGEAPTAPMAPIGAPSSSRSSALPFKPAAKHSASSPPPAPAAPPALARTRFSLEQFASLAAEIAAAPAKVAEVRARYGLDEASHRREAEAWNQRFSTDAELYRRYGALFKSYRD